MENPHLKRPSRRLPLLQIFSEAGLAELYQERQSVKPTEGNRTFANLILVGFIVVVLFSALFSLIWVQRSEFAYLRSLSGVSILPNDGLTWQISTAAAAECRDKSQCVATLRSTPPAFNHRDLFTFDLLNAAHQDDLLISTTVRADQWREAAPDVPGVPVVLALPALRYDAADVYINGNFLQQFFNSEPLAVTVPVKPGEASDFHVEIHARPAEAQSVLMNGARESHLVFIAQQSRYQKYADLVAAKRSGAGKQLADIARIVLAIFSLLLFIFVDSSPECLGLALFMGLKAVGVTLAQNWLPDAWVSSTLNSDLKSFLLCFGDIVQLYFFVQLARVGRPNLKPWFLYGGLIALAYAAATHFKFTTFGIDWNMQIWRWRNVIIGLCCMTAAVTAARFCFRKKLYFRSTALTIATSGTIVQIVYPLVSAFPSVFATDWFQSLYNAFEMHTPYVFALSTFINISTLETRLKNLTKELLTAKEIEREMALGQTVQQSFLHLPKIPEMMRVVCDHKPALYVSGDIYYVHWDEEREVLNMLVTDVSGHGVQAALKASVCSTLAESLWAENHLRGTDVNASRLAIYDQRLHTYLSRISREDEIVAMIGGEFDYKRKVVALYRCNGTFPILILPDKITNKWNVEVLALKNRQLTEFPMPHGGYVLFISDGYIDTGRMLAAFSRYLERKVNSSAMTLDENRLKSLVLGFDSFSKANDDKTILLFRFLEPREEAWQVIHSAA